MSVKGKKQYWLIFLRTLAAFLAFWLLMAIVLTVKNRDNQIDMLKDNHKNAADLLREEVKEVRGGTAPPEEQDAIITWRMSTASYFNGRYLSVSRLFDEWGNEVTRSQLAMGSITMPGTFTYDHFILFDAVLTYEEQITLAERLRENNYRMTRFYGSAYRNWGTTPPNMGLYGEVTGILQEGNVIYPQKLVYCYEDGPVVLMQSSHAMFEGAQLTTLRFDAAQITSALAWGDASPRELLELYYDASDTIDRVAGKQEGGMAFGSRGGGSYFPSKDVPIAYAYSYFPWQLATYDLNFPYTATFLIALLASALVSVMQIRSMKRERQFTRAVAHELKTPAAVLRAYAEALSEDVAPERRQEYLAAIVEESDRMAALVNELLDLSRLEGAKKALTREPVDLTALVREGFERLRVPMEERGLTLELDLEPVTVEGDPGRLEQMVSNLAVNALRHASPGPVRVFLKREEGRAVLTMDNFCPPIPPEKLKRIWEPFYKVGEDRSGEGSGLGLAVVRNVVALHGGFCRAESLPDGIHFHVELP